MDIDEFPNQVPIDVFVSVRLTTYNQVKFIAKAIEGVLLQDTGFPFEICIGEDDSTDGTREICLDYAKKYPEIIRLFLRHDKDKIYVNGTKTGRLNSSRTRRACRGKYMALLEGDDCWMDPTKLARSVRILESDPTLFGTYHNVDVVYEADSAKNHLWYGPDIVKPTRIRARNLIYGVCMNLSSVVHRNVHVIDHYEYKNTLSGDVIGFARFANIGDFAYIDEVMGLYRKHDAGIYSGMSNRAQVRMAFSTLRALELILKKEDLAELRLQGLLRSIRCKCLDEVPYWIYKNCLSFFEPCGFLRMLKRKFAGLENEANVP